MILEFGEPSQNFVSNFTVPVTGSYFSFRNLTNVFLSVTSVLCSQQLAYLQSSLDKLNEAIKLAKVRYFFICPTVGKF